MCKVVVDVCYTGAVRAGEPSAEVVVSRVVEEDAKPHLRECAAASWRGAHLTLPNNSHLNVKNLPKT